MKLKKDKLIGYGLAWILLLLWAVFKEFETKIVLLFIALALVSLFSPWLYPKRNTGKCKWVKKTNH